MYFPTYVYFVRDEKADSKPIFYVYFYYCIQNHGNTTSVFKHGTNIVTHNT